MAQLPPRRRAQLRLRETAVDATAAFCSLPSELLNCVVEHLGLYDTVRLACVSKTLKPICEAQLNSWRSRYCAEGLPTPRTSQLPELLDVRIIGGEHAGKFGVTCPLFAENWNDPSEQLALAGITDVEDIPQRHAVVFFSPLNISAVLPYRFIEITNHEFYAFTIRAHKGDVSAMRTLGSCLHGHATPDPWSRPQGGVRQCLFEGGYWMAAARACGSKFARRDFEDIGAPLLLKRNPIVPHFDSLAEAEAWPNWSDESEDEDDEGVDIDYEDDEELEGNYHHPMNGIEDAEYYS